MSTVSGQGQKVVLVVEDEHLVRRVVCRTLESRGYNVLQSESGDDALALAREFAGDIDLLLTDINLEGMSGNALAVKLAADHPAMHVVFTSGYSSEAMSQTVPEERTTFLQKPFGTTELIELVAEIIGPK